MDGFKKELKEALKKSGSPTSYIWDLEVALADERRQNEEWLSISQLARKRIRELEEGLKESGSAARVLIQLLEADNSELRKWIDDLQSGMFVNCVYCGHRYGPNQSTPVSMADVLKAHIEVCAKHPMSKLMTENAALRKQLEEAEAQMGDEYNWERK
jgi:hypothetical protein